MLHIDLFSGIGGFAYAARQVWPDYRNLFFCDNNKFCQAVLRKNFGSDSLIYGDIREVTLERVIKDAGREKLSAGVDLLTGGFPCQDVSNAGKRAGIDGQRSGLWKEMVRIISQFTPSWCIIENVAGLVSNGLHRVLSDLNEVGYNAYWNCIPAAYIGAPHIRDRIWIVAYPQRVGIDKPMEIRRILIDGWGEKIGGESWVEFVVDNNEVAPSKWRSPGQPCPRPLLVRGDDGLSAGVDGLKLSKSKHREERLKALGNAIVPQVAIEIMKAIKNSSS